MPSAPWGCPPGLVPSEKRPAAARAHERAPDQQIDSAEPSGLMPRAKAAAGCSRPPEIEPGPGPITQTTRPPRSGRCSVHDQFWRTKTGPRKGMSPSPGTGQGSTWGPGTRRGGCPGSTPGSRHRSARTSPPRTCGSRKVDPRDADDGCDRCPTPAQTRTPPRRCRGEACGESGHGREEDGAVERRLSTPAFSVRVSPSAASTSGEAAANHADSRIVGSMSIIWPPPGGSPPVGRRAESHQCPLDDAAQRGVELERHGSWTLPTLRAAKKKATGAMGPERYPRAWPRGARGNT